MGPNSLRNACTRWLGFVSLMKCFIIRTLQVSSPTPYITLLNPCFSLAQFADTLLCQVARCRLTGCNR